MIFAVEDRAAVDAWSGHLDGLGVANQVVEATIGWMVLFHDPDGLEIHCTAGTAATWTTRADPATGAR